GVTERSVVPAKPGNAGGGKGPWFKVSVRRDRHPGDWREPNTSSYGWEVRDGVAHQSEELARLPVLCPVRQAVSSRHPGVGHAELLKSVSRRISDGRMLRLVKMWLETPVEETDAKGNRHRTTRNKDQGMGTPQGAPISPLLSNIYMRRFVKGWKDGGHEKRLAARIVNYADDFVICCKGTADEAMTVMRGMMSKLKLTVNETKTRMCRLPDESFDFLGYTLGRNYDCRTGESYLGPRPSRKKIDRLCREIGELTTRKMAGRDVGAQVGRINRKLKGWSNYFRLGTVTKAYRNVDSHLRYRVRQWLCVKFKVRGQGTARFPDQHLYQKLGLYRLPGT